MEKVILIGYDPEIIEMILNLKRFSIAGYIDKVKIKKDTFDLDYLGNDYEFTDNYSFQSTHKLLITIDDTKIRSELYEYYKKFSYNFETIISQKSSVSNYCKIEDGCIVQDLVNISHGVFLNKNVKVNTGANVMHDVIVGEHSTLAPNAVILGYVNIGKCCFIGSNSTILPKINLDVNTILGAGSVATKNLDKGVYTGVPARKLKK